MPTKKVHGYNFPIKNISYLEDKDKKLLGTGGSGSAYLYNLGGGSKIVVKEVGLKGPRGGKKNYRTLKNNAEEIKSEQERSLRIYATVPRYLRRYFMKPVILKYRSKQIPYDVYAASVYLPGTTPLGKKLRELIMGSKFKELTKLMHNVRKACYGMWAHGIIHGDLNNDNILVKKNLGVKIIDFGLSKIMNKPNNLSWKIGKRKKMLSELSPEWLEWFNSRYKALLRRHGFPTSNPNIMSFPSQVNRKMVFHKNSYNKLRIANLLL